MRRILNLSALVAAAVAISCGDHKRRISQFLAGSNGQEIPDEDGARWLGRLQDDGQVRLEKSWNGGYEQFTVPASAFDSVVVGGDQGEGRTEDEEGPEASLEEVVSGIPAEKVYGLTVLADRYKKALEEREAWTPEMEEELDAWFLSLEDSEMESLVAVGLGPDEESTGDASGTGSDSPDSSTGDASGTGLADDQEAEGRGAPVAPEAAEQGERRTKDGEGPEASPEEGQKAKRGKKDKPDADV